jgi:predicted unusual protein kinase regulating ubiquinone biosynthesis (AarF/ABC1/UbiB family)
MNDRTGSAAGFEPISLWRRGIRIVWLAVGVFLSYQIHLLVSRFYTRAALIRRRKALHRCKAVRLREEAIELKGVLIKLGQFLSARADLLPEEYVEELSRLQDQVPPADPTLIRARLMREMGRPPEEVYDSFSPVPLAAASLGQVHEARLRTGERVAVKVQYPGIERVVETDLRAVRWIGRMAGWWWRRIRFDLLYEEFSRILRSELDYIAEAHSAERFREQFESDHRVVVPRVVWDHTTTHVLTLEYVEGIKITEFGLIEKQGVKLPDVAHLLTESYIRQIFEHSFLHGDPHPGNLFVQIDHPTPHPPRLRLVFVDFGLMQPLTPDMKEGIKRTIWAVIRRDIPEIVKGLVDLGFFDRSGNLHEVEKAAAFFIERYRDIRPSALKQITLQEVHEDLERLFDIAPLIQLPQNYILLWRTVGMLSGICSRLDPQLNLIELARPYVSAFIEKETSWTDRVWSEVKQTAEAILRLPKELDRFLTRANRGEFKTQMSSEDVTGAILKLYRLLYRATLGFFGLGLLALASFFFRAGYGWEGGIAVAIGLGCAAALLGSVRRGGRR